MRQSRSRRGLSPRVSVSMAIDGAMSVPRLRLSGRSSLWRWICAGGIRFIFWFGGSGVMER